MADITGNIGSESVRLRGMALEVTQSALLEEIRDMTDKLEDVLKNIPGANRSENQSRRRNQRYTDEALQGLAVTADSIRRTDANRRSSMKDFIKGLENTSNTLGKLVDNPIIRTIRGWDSQIQNSSFALREFAAGSRGLTGALAKFSADSIDQMQEQFDVYKKLTVIGGATAGDFAYLREHASRLGITMQEYVGLIQDNFIQLRTGGASLRKTLQGLRDDSDRLRQNTGGISDQFMSLGVSAHDYGKMILQNTALLGGYAKARRMYDGNFDSTMLNMTKRAQELAEAFGFNREQIMEASKKAMDDTLFANIFDSLKAQLGEAGGKGLDQALQLFTGLTGGDVEKAKRMLVAAYTGMHTEETAAYETMQQGFFNNVKRFTTALGEGMDIEQAAKLLQPMMDNIKARGARLDQSLTVFSNDFDKNARGAESVLQMMARMFSTDPKAIMNKVTTDAEKNSQKQLEAFGRIQRVNIDLAVQFASLNRVMNEFGLGLANVFQLLSVSASLLAKRGIDTVTGSTEWQIVQELIGSIQGRASGLTGILSPEGMETIRRELTTETPRIPGTQPTQTNQQGVRTLTDTSGLPNMLPRTVDPNSRVIFGSRSTGYTNTTAGQAGIGPNHLPHDLGLNSALSMMASSAELTGGNTLYVTSMRRAGSTSAHGQGMAMDLAIPGLGAEGYRGLHARMVKMMKDAGLDVSEAFDGKGDLSIVNEGPGGVVTPHRTGDHIHFQFNSPAAAEKFRRIFNEKYGTSNNGGPNRTGLLMPPGMDTGGSGSANRALASLNLGGASGSEYTDGQVNYTSASGSSMISSSNGIVTVALDDTSAENLASKIMTQISMGIGSHLATIADNSGRSHFTSV